MGKREKKKKKRNQGEEKERKIKIKKIHGWYTRNCGRKEKSKQSIEAGVRVELRVVKKGGMVANGRPGRRKAGRMEK